MADNPLLGAIKEKERGHTSNSKSSASSSSSSRRSTSLKKSADKAGLTRNSPKPDDSLPSCSKELNSEDTTQCEKETMAHDMAIVKEQLAMLVPTIHKIQEIVFTQDDSSDSETTSEEEGELNDNKGLEHFMNLSNGSEKVGPIVDEQLAQGTETMLTKGFKKEEKEKLFEKYLIPENCQRLKVIPCNEEIYKTASKNSRITDSQLQTVQASLCKGITAVMYNFNKLLPLVNGEEQSSTEKILELTTHTADSMALLTNASYQLDMVRKSVFQKDFRHEYKSICKDENISGKLFGQDLKEKITEITEVNKVTSKITNQYKGNRKRKNTTSTFLDKRNPKEKKKQDTKKKFSYKKKAQYSKTKKEKK